MVTWDQVLKVGSSLNSRIWRSQSARCARNSSKNASIASERTIVPYAPSDTKLLPIFGCKHFFFLPKFLRDFVLGRRGAGLVDALGCAEDGIGLGGFPWKDGGGYSGQGLGEC